MLSIVIPTLNEEKYLPKLLASIRNQTYRDYEVIVSDSNSKDNTLKVAKKYGCRTTNHKKGSPAKARNAGAKIAKGDTILFLDADVLLGPEFLEKNMTDYKRRGLKIATCWMDPIEGNLFDKIIHGFANLLLFLFQWLVPAAPGFCIFADKKIHDKIGGFDETLKMSEDTDFARRAAKLGKFGALTSGKVQVSMRRWEEEGRLKILSKYVLSFFYNHLHLSMKGKFFNYKFGKHD